MPKSDKRKKRKNKIKTMLNPIKQNFDYGERISRLNKLLKSAEENNQNIIEDDEDDWDVEAEERIIQETQAWNEFEQRKLEDKFIPETSEVDGMELLKKHEWLLDDKRIFGDSERFEHDSEFSRRQDTNNIAFIRRNLKFFNRITQSGEPVYLTSGAEGSVWQLADGKILKLMKYYDAFEKYKINSSLLFSKNDVAKNEMMIHESGSLGTYEDFSYIQTLKDGKYLPELKATIVTVYYIITEKFLTVHNSALADIQSTLFRILSSAGNDAEDMLRDGRIPPGFSSFAKIIRRLFDIRRELSNAIEEKTDMLSALLANPEVYDLIKRMAKSMAFIYKSSPLVKIIEEAIHSSNLPLADDWLESLMEQMLTKAFSGRVDFHAGNIGLRETTGHFIIFDA